MPPFAWVFVALSAGVLLVVGASQATASVAEGRTFVRWMIVVFITFLALASIPIIAGS